VSGFASWWVLGFKKKRGFCFRDDLKQPMIFTLLNQGSDIIDNESPIADELGKAQNMFIFFQLPQTTCNRYPSKEYGWLVGFRISAHESR
jgi:hypothetical protein